MFSNGKAFSKTCYISLSNTCLKILLNKGKKNIRTHKKLKKNGLKNEYVILNSISLLYLLQ
jgi:hypothetical protein